MIGQRIGKHWIVGCALLLLLGCKPAPPAAEPFVPNQPEHFHHTKIASRFGLACDTCHKGKTEKVGYQPVPR